MLSKQIYLLTSETENEIIQFLDKVEEVGVDISSTINDDSKTISYEARLLKMYFYKLFK
eukprot:UN12672